MKKTEALKKLTTFILALIDWLIDSKRIKKKTKRRSSCCEIQIGSFLKIPRERESCQKNRLISSDLKPKTFPRFHEIATSEESKEVRSSFVFYLFFDWGEDYILEEMGSKREEERKEKIIRGLMKLPPNRRCINCNSLVCVSILFFFFFRF